MIGHAGSVLSARGLTAVLDVGDTPVRVLDDITLDVRAGEMVDIVGPSGSGKSTLLRALARLLPGASGQLALAGRPAADIGPQEWRCEVALVPQKPAIVPGEVRANLVLPWRLKARAHVAPPPDGRLTAALADVGLGDIALDRDAARLSVGQQARLAFVRVVLAEPRVLLLDEADAALDDDSAELVSAMTGRFVADGSDATHGGRAVIRVKHRGVDGREARRLRMADGALTEVIA